MSTLVVVEEILREANQPLSVREIVERAGPALPTRSKTPDTVVARDLSMDLKRKADESMFVRASPGRYTLRSMAAAYAHGDPATTRASSMGEHDATATSGRETDVHVTTDATDAPAIMSHEIGGVRAGTRPAATPTTAKPTSYSA
jgi:hypothetical protein